MGSLDIVQTLWWSGDWAPSDLHKGGTSLSKAYGVIQRFSEDIDLTVDIRHLLHDLVREGAE